MNSRYSGLFGLAIGLALASPVQAAPVFVDDAFVVAQRGDDVRQGPRDSRRNERPAPRRGVEREEPRGYGYGYERRHQREREEAQEEDRRRPREGRPREER